MSRTRRVAGTFSKHALLIVASVLALFPVYVMITAAFKTEESFSAHPWAPIASPSLGGFRAAVNDQFPRWFENTVIVSSASVVVTLLVAALAAWGFAHWAFRGRDACWACSSR